MKFVSLEANLGGVGNFSLSHFSFLSPSLEGVLSWLKYCWLGLKNQQQIWDFVWCTAPRWPQNGDWNSCLLSNFIYALYILIQMLALSKLHCSKVATIMATGFQFHLSNLRQIVTHFLLYAHKDWVIAPFQLMPLCKALRLESDSSYFANIFIQPAYTSSDHSLGPSPIV